MQSENLLVNRKRVLRVMRERGLLVRSRRLRARRKKEWGRVEAAQAAARIHPDWRRRYMHLAMRRHKSIAKVAMGRRDVATANNPPSFKRTKPFRPTVTIGRLLC
jgi:hypothetical protein